MARRPGNVESIGRLLADAQQRRRRTLTEPETKAILELAGMSVPREHVATSARDAARAASEFGFPVVLKIVSPDLPHKTDVGGVRTALDSEKAVQRAHRSMLAAVRRASPRARIDGVLVQPQLRGREVILGATRDPQFGPIIVFGLGGVAVEVLGDVAFRVVPLKKRDAREMLTEIRAARLLDSFRGAAAVNKRSILAAIMRLSDLMYRFGDVIHEIEINPLMVTADRAVAVDAMAVIASRAR